MTDSDALYRAVGQNIREARKRAGQNVSQDKLASRLGISRASVVNIEAGRQHPPLHLLWQIAETLGTDLSLLIPRRGELEPPADTPIKLEEEMIRQIERELHGDPAAQKSLTAFVSKAKATIDAAPTKETP